MRLRNSFWAMLGRDEQAEAPADALERVRASMLEVLKPFKLSHRTRVESRVMFARDFDALWYMRPEIMNAIAASHGEAAARQCLMLITEQFQGHHPGAAQRRPGLR